MYICYLNLLEELRNKNSPYHFFQLVYIVADHGTS